MKLSVATICISIAAISASLKSWPESGACFQTYTLIDEMDGQISNRNDGRDAILSNYGDNESCTWIILASDPNYHVSITFTEFATECGYDFVTIGDMSASSTQIVAKLCGNRPNSTTVISSGNGLVVVWESDQVITSTGFKAKFTLIPPHQDCMDDSNCGRNGVCKIGKCHCDDWHRGTKCEFNTGGLDSFSPREGHSVAYDPISDVAYLTFGRKWGTIGNTSYVLFDDFYIYNFQTWTKVIPRIGFEAPARRFGHYSWIHDGRLYVFGGNDGSIGFIDIWSYDIISNKWTQQQISNSIVEMSKLLNPQVIYVPGNYSLENGLRYYDLYIYSGAEGDDSNQFFVYKSGIKL